MQEDFLHFIWKYQKLEILQLTTVLNETILVHSPGVHNQNSGPDFFNSKLTIGSQLWAGNVEIHKKSSDWYVHRHEIDTAYDNVILHVVWEHDVEVFRKDNTAIPTVELKHYVSNDLIGSYENLMSKKQTWINCEQDFAVVDDFVIGNWLERLFIERLERKSEDIESLLRQSENDWEAVLFKMLAKNFGLNVNGDAFLGMANSLDYSVLRKQQSKLNNLEALLFGQAGLLDEEIEESYIVELQAEYTFLKTKFKLSNVGVIAPKFFRLRPTNFPTVRLSQLANLYFKEHHLFSKVIQIEKLVDFIELFSVSTSTFWETHYTFNKQSKHSKKKLSKSFIELIIINTIVPFKFSYAKHLGDDINESIINLMQQLKSEKNSVVNKFNSLKIVSNSAIESQALLQLKNEYCDKNYCLQCAIGNSLLNK